jgi:hypothetical protein
VRPPIGSLRPCRHLDEIDARARHILAAPPITTAPRITAAAQHRDDDLAATVTGHGVICDLHRPPRDDLLERERTRGRRSELRDGIGLKRREERRRRLEGWFELGVERWTGARGHLDPPVSVTPTAEATHPGCSKRSGKRTGPVLPETGSHSPGPSASIPGIRAASRGSATLMSVRATKWPRQ